MKNTSKRRVVVTGGAGFIGSALVCALNDRAIDDILIVDRLHADDKWKNLVALRYADYIDADDFIETLLEDPKAFGKPATVFHLGACSSTTQTDADYLMRNNYEYTKHLASWALERDVRFVYASSAATYGSLETGLTEDRPLEELRPLNMYAYSKQRFDQYAQRNGWLDSITGVKYFNVFGPNEAHKGDMRSVVQKAYEQIASGQSVKLFKSYRPEFKDGEQERDFIYVKDAVEMTLFLAERDAHGIYNVGSGQAHTWLELIRPIFAAVEKPEQIEFIEMPPALQPKYQYSTRASIEKIRAAGYEASITPLEDAVADYVKNYLSVDRRLEPHAR